MSVSSNLEIVTNASIANSSLSSFRNSKQQQGRIRRLPRHVSPRLQLPVQAQGMEKHAGQWRALKTPNAQESTEIRNLRILGWSLGGVSYFP